MKRPPPNHRLIRVLACSVCAAGLLLLGGCDGDDGATGPAGPAGPQGPSGDPDDTGLSTELGPDEDAPGVNLEILSVTGASGTDGSFQVGDSITVTYTVEMDDGTDWDLSRFNFARALVSGPTFNYQRVLEEVSDLDANSVANSDGSHSYTFAVPIPRAYLAPLNDTPSFDAEDGELTGQPLMAGTYTLGVYFAWNYTVDDESFRDVGNATFDFLFGGATALAPREVVKLDNCNQCHVDLEAHGGLRRDPNLCVLCHTAGAEDRNVPSVAGGTPGASIDFKVMVHKIHNGRHLPSVLGIGLNLLSGTPDYAARAKPYQLVGFGDRLHDYSGVSFPFGPSPALAMPKDGGYSALDPEDQKKEDAQRKGAVGCIACHGDPDGRGPLTAPSQGEVAFQQPARNSCGSCHDDIDWAAPYVANSMTMPANSTACNACHPQAGSGIAVMDAHTHPLLDSSFNPGLNFNLLSVVEAVPDDGVVDPGDRVAISFTMTDDSGADVAPTDLAELNFALSGPTSNLNLLAQGSIPTAVLSGAQPYTVNLPAPIDLEFAGDSTGNVTPDVFATRGAPHLAVTGAPTTVFLRSGAEAPVMLSAEALAPQNYLDVDDGSVFERNDFIVVDDGVGAVEEYLLIQQVEGDRLWFSSPAQTQAEFMAPAVYKPGTEFDHPMGASVQVVSLTEAAVGVDYTLDPEAGTITEVIEFGTGTAVVVSYTADFVMPAEYPLALNDSPELGENRGHWAGKSLVDGTYKVALWGHRSLALNEFGETNTYLAAARAVSLDFLVGSATEIEAYGLISTADNCYACHQDLYAHEGAQRGFESCVMCHGSAGSEDRPQYRAPNAPATPGLDVRFRSMLHSIHMGADLANASTYTVVGSGPSSDYPNNFSEATFGGGRFPAFPAGPKQCLKCHGEGNTAWMTPMPVDHPTEQVLPSQPWTAACSSCHDTSAALAHIAAQTAPSGAESCTICHEETGALSIGAVHKTR